MDGAVRLQHLAASTGAHQGEGTSMRSSMRTLLQADDYHAFTGFWLGAWP